MFRVLVILAALFVLALAASWLADHPGTIEYVWLGKSGALTTTEAAALVAGAALGLLLLAELVRMLWRLPAQLAARRRRTRQARGWTALSTGVVAVGAGDARSASRAASEALAALPDTPLAVFLAAQAAQLAGNRTEAAQHFTSLAADPSTATLGLHGLAVEARRAGDHAAALVHARAALALDPALPWAAATVFEAAAASGDFDEALAQLERNAKARLVDRATARRLRAVLLTGKAMTDSAREAALEAHNLDKSFVPAALAASAAVSGRNPRQAASILEEAYRRTPHPDLFRAALDLVGGSADARFKRAQALAALRPDDLESALGLARAALSARAPELAREALVPHLDRNATQRVCILMAELEALAPGDEGRVREWLARAVRAPRDPQWIADGVTSAHWAPVSPVTGRLDAFEWRVPRFIGEPPVPAIDLAALRSEPAAMTGPGENRLPSPPPSVPQS